MVGIEFEDIVMSEMEVQNFFLEYLRKQGFIVCTQCDREDIPAYCKICPFNKEGYRGNRYGVDIIGRKGDRCLIMELKGSKYKNSASYGVDFLTLLGQILLNMKKIDSEEVTYAIGLPYHKYYRTNLERFAKSEAVEKLGIHLKLIIKKEGKADVILVE